MANTKHGVTSLLISGCLSMLAGCGSVAEPSDPLGESTEALTYGTVVTLFENENYGGESILLAAPTDSPGRIARLRWYSPEFWNDRISSMQIPVGSGISVVLYEHSDCSGNSKILYDNSPTNPNSIPRLSDYGFDNSASCIDLY